MPSKNLWGDFKEFQTIRSPKAILAEQAEHLSATTASLLVGDVGTRRTISRETFRYDLEIEVPGLNDYRYTVLSIEHDIDLYPVKLVSSRPKRSIECNDEQMFEKVVASILGSEDIKRVVSRLLAQVT